MRWQRYDARRQLVLAYETPAAVTRAADRSIACQHAQHILLPVKTCWPRGVRWWLRPRALWGRAHRWSAAALFAGGCRPPQPPQPRFLHATQAATVSTLSWCSGRRWRRLIRELRQPKTTWVLGGSSKTRNAISQNRRFFGAWEWVRFEALVKTRAVVTSAGQESQLLLRYASAKLDGRQAEP